MKRPGSNGNLVIDFQHHYVPYELAARSGATGRGKVVVRDGASPKVTLHEKLYDLDIHIKDMDEAGIDVAALSCLLGWDASAADCRLINDRLAQAQQAYPGRFVGLAHVPANEPASAVAELRRAVTELGLKGMTLTSQIFGRPLDAPEFFQIYQAAAELQVPIFVHPAMAPKGYALAEDHDLGRIIGREFDLALAATRLIAGGVLETFPSLKFVIGHFGGGISAIKDRLVKKAYRFDRPLKRPFSEYFDMLYFDMAGFEGGDLALHCALRGIQPERLVFATDYPQDFTGATTSSGPEAMTMPGYIASIRQQAAPADAAKMLGGNAARLLGLGSGN
ncbi:MAG: amidohydrolase family protein [Acidobacteria bacterium]|nr:amidohydrolase family protein [Acidobacteriota bacterium]